MRITPVSIGAALVVAALPVVLSAQSPRKEDPSRDRVEVTGCVKGSTLTETNLRVSPGRDENPARRWRLRGPKALMAQLKEHAGKELAIVGTTKNARSGMAIGSTRIGKTNIYIGGAGKPAGEPLPEQPTIDVESFDVTGETCR